MDGSSIGAIFVGALAQLLVDGTRALCRGSEGASLQAVGPAKCGSETSQAAGPSGCQVLARTPKKKVCALWAQPQLSHLQLSVWRWRWQYRCQTILYDGRKTRTLTINVVMPMPCQVHLELIKHIFQRRLQILCHSNHLQGRHPCTDQPTSNCKCDSKHQFVAHSLAAQDGASDRRPAARSCTLSIA